MIKGKVFGLLLLLVVVNSARAMRSKKDFTIEVSWRGLISANYPMDEKEKGLFVRDIHCIVLDKLTEAKVNNTKKISIDFEHAQKRGIDYVYETVGKIHHNLTAEQSALLASTGNNLQKLPRCYDAVSKTFTDHAAVINELSKLANEIQLLTLVLIKQVKNIALKAIKDAGEKLKADEIKDEITGDILYTCSK